MQRVEINVVRDLVVCILNILGYKMSRVFIILIVLVLMVVIIFGYFVCDGIICYDFLCYYFYYGLQIKQYLFFFDGIEIYIQKRQDRL